MMPLSHRQAQAIRRRKARADQDEWDRTAAADGARTAALCGLAAVDAVWSNQSCEWFHLACRATAPTPTVDLANLEPTTTRCAACGAWLSDPPQDARGST
jgi:hypothetical protein